MAMGNEMDYEAIAKEAALRILAAMGAEAGKAAPSGGSRPKVLVCAGSYARRETIREAAEALGSGSSGYLVLDPLGRDPGNGAASRKEFRAIEPELDEDASLVLVGLSLFELEALAAMAAGNEHAEAVAFFLGSSRRVRLGADHEGRFAGFRGELAGRSRRALSTLAGLGVECMGKGAQTGQGRAGLAAAGRCPKAPGPGPAPAGAPGFVSADIIRGLERGSTLRVAARSILTPLARDEARERNIRIETAE